MGRRRKDKRRIIPEQDRSICGSICLCQLTLVLSCVAMVYLAVAVYTPAYQAFNAGLDPTPVMCQTVNAAWVNNCEWASCGEWCLTKTSGYCMQLHVTARNNGTDITVENCTRLNTVSCPQVNVRALKRYNCNNDSECATLTGVFNCSLGHCANMSELFLCHHKADGIVVDSDKDNLKLNGFFECKKSKCTKIKRPFLCDRYCNKITTSSMNLFIQYEDNVYAGDCRQVKVGDKQIWNEQEIFLASCHTVERHGNSLRATDCLNGTILEESKLPQPFVNFSVFWTLVANSTTPVDPTQEFVPWQSKLTIYNYSRLLINLEGCVNTLRGECGQFHATHDSDGDNNTAQSRYPCYINRNDSTTVVSRFNLDKTRRELLVAVLVPLILFVVSLISLVFIAHSVQVGDDAKMRWRWNWLASRAGDADVADCIGLGGEAAD
ncbi:uncharacterized protein LOC111050185, partial [Nilaparvata lugens]